MKNVCKFIVLFSLSLSIIISTPVLAQTSIPLNNSLSNLKVDYTSMLGHEGRGYEELVSELINDGLTQDDADYYAKMDILVNQIELHNIDVESCLKDEKKLPDDYIRLNPDDVRSRALNLEPSALKTVLSQNDALDEGKKVAQNAMNAMEQESNQCFDITVDFGDGSKIIATSDTVKDKAEDTELVTNTDDTHVKGPWNSSHFYDYDLTYKTNGNYTTKSSWKYISGNSIAKVEDVYKWSYKVAKDGKKSATYISDSGASSYAGVVTVDSENISNHQNKLADEDGEYIQGYTDVVFSVSGSFAGTFEGVLSISVNAGAGWHEYCITEVANYGGARMYAGQFV